MLGITPDTNTLLGEVPEIKNFFVCCGFNSIGIGSGGGAGKVTAEWMMNGHINEDLFIYDLYRFQKFHSKVKFISERISETKGDLYGLRRHYICLYMFQHVYAFFNVVRYFYVLL